MKNEPAFPSCVQYFPNDTNYEENQGMTLRDYFAAKAMQHERLFADTAEAIARRCYKLADAMMEERKK